MNSILSIIVLSFFTVSAFGQNEFQFRKVRVVMPEKTLITTEDDVFFTFLPQYIGLKPDQLFDIDASKIPLEKDTLYECTIHLYVTDTVTHSSRNSHRLANTFEFTKNQLIDGIVQIPFDLCKNDAFIMPGKNILLDIRIREKSRRYHIFSRISLMPYKN